MEEDEKEEGGKECWFDSGKLSLLRVRACMAHFKIRGLLHALLSLHLIANSALMHAKWLSSVRHSYACCGLTALNVEPDSLYHTPRGRQIRVEKETWVLMRERNRMRAFLTMVTECMDEGRLGEITQLFVGARHHS